MKSLVCHLRKIILVAVAVFAIATPGHAGGSGDSKVGVEKFGQEAIRTFAQTVNEELDRRKVNLAIIARAGRPRSEMPRGISYTHVAFVVFEPVQAADGRLDYTYTVYNLYQGADGRDDRSYLKQDLTYDFVAGMCERDVAICVPNELLQKRIIAVIRSPAYRALHNPNYNLVTNPWVDRFDNCVTHSVKICMAAIYQTDDRARIYDDIRAYFHPTPVRLGPLQSLGASFMSGFSQEDRDPSGLQTATYNSLEKFLATNGLEQDAFTLSLPPVAPLDTPTSKN